MTRLSIVIPWLASDPLHEDTLASVLANQPPQTEVIVVHRGVYDDPYELASEVRFIEADRHADQLDLVNLGADEADGEILHILCGGLEATPDWTVEPLHLLADDAVAAVAPLITDRDEERVLCGGVKATRSGRRESRHGGRRSTLINSTEPDGPSIQAGFYRIDRWDAAGGLDETMGHMADLDLALCLAEVGNCRVARSSILHEVRLPDRDSAGFVVGRNAARFLGRFRDRCGFSTSRFWLEAVLRLTAGFYRPVAWLEALGQISGALGRRDAARFERRWAELEAESAALQTPPTRAAA